MASIEDYPDSRKVKDAIQSDIKGDLTELNNEIAALSSGSGVLVSSNDSTVGYLNGKLVAGNGVTLTEGNDGANETLTVRAEASLVSDAASLGTGSVDGEMRTTVDNGNSYTWDATNAKWRITGCNIYSSAPSSTVYTIPNGTLAVISGVLKMYNSGTWSEIGASQMPVGALVMMPVGTVPTGYLEADGSAVSRTTYADLFAVYGTFFGAGDGSTTFNVIDMRGYTVRGWDHGAGVDPDAASRTDRGDGTTGDAPGTKQADEIISHRHHHTPAGGVQLPINGNMIDYGGARHSLDPGYTDYTGGNETRMKNINVMFCIYTG